MSRLLYRRSSGPAASLGLLALRLVMGAAFILHGWSKIQSPLSWMPADAPVPGFLQLLAAVAEFGGGILLILGLLTPLAALGLLCTMIGALLMVHFPNGDSFVMGDSTFELPLTYLSAALLFLLAGPGRLSADLRAVRLEAVERPRRAASSSRRPAPRGRNAVADRRPLIEAARSSNQHRVAEGEEAILFFVRLLVRLVQ